jgi:hypothetical protein
LDKLAMDQHNRVARIGKELADYRIQADRPFEHEERLKRLLTRQAELDSLLDLDKGDQQGAGPVPDEPDLERASSASQNRDAVAEMARMNMRQSGAAIREMPISERAAPQTGHVTASVVARDDSHIAFSTAGNSFFILPRITLGRDVQIGERLSLRFHQGRASIENSRALAR